MARRPRRRGSGLRNGGLGRRPQGELLWTAGAVAAILLAIAPQFGLRIREYRPGDVAVADITAPVDLQVVDPVSTERRRAEAAARVGQVYDLNPEAWRPAADTVRAVFAWGRRARADGGRWERLDAGRRAEFHRQAQEAAGRPLPEALLAALWAEGFGLDTELRLVGAIKDLLEEELVVNLDAVPLEVGGSGVTVRDIATQQEHRLGDLSVALDLEEARRALADRVAARLALEPEAERLLAAMAAALLRPNLTYNSNETQLRRQQAVASVEPVFYQVKRGRRILREGDEVTEQAILELQALQAQWGTGRPLGSVLGNALLIGLAVLALWRSVADGRRRSDPRRRRVYVLLLVVLVGMVVLTRVSLFVSDAVANAFAREPFSVADCYRFATPLAAGSLLVLLLVGIRTAWVFAAVFGAVVAVLTQDLALTLLALLGSFAGIYGMSQYKQRTALVAAGALVGGVNVLVTLGLALLAQPGAHWSITAFQAACAMGGGILASAVVSVSLPTLEHLFHRLTDIKLLELSNMNLPLLRELAVRAPGTYHHSVVVGALAEKAAEAIEVNPLFVRVAAYYHDIGKIRQPHYFVENQRDGHNPHDKLSPHMSALVLVSHIKEGIAYAREHGLPQPLVEIIPQHHGTRLMSYFYDKARQRAGRDGGDVDPDDFRYPGPKPQTKEAALLMLADSVEAVSRALSDPSPARLRAAIRKVIREVVEDEQLDECGLTLSDLSRIAGAFLAVLAAMHHQRIEYPSGAGPQRASPEPGDEDRRTELPDPAHP